MKRFCGFIVLIVSLMLSACTSQEKPPLLVLDVPDVHSAAYSPDGKTMLTTSGEITQLRDATTGAIVRQLETDSVSAASDASYSPDGKLIVTTNNATIDENGLPEAGIVLQWDAATGEKIASFPQNEGVFHAVYRPDGTSILIARTDNMAILQDVANAPASTDLWGIRLKTAGVPAADTGGYLLALNEEIIFNAVHLLQNPAMPRYDIQLALIATASVACQYQAENPGEFDGAIPRWQVDAQLTITDLQTSETIYTELLPGELAEECPETASSDLGYIAGMPVESIIAGSIITALETREGALPEGILLRLSGGSNPQDMIYDAGFSPDGSQIVTSEGYGTVFIWDAASATEPVQSLYRHTAPVRRVRYNPDGSQIATAGEDNMAIIWDAAGGDPLHLLKSSDGHFFNDVMFSPDGRYLVTAGTDSTIQVWQVTDGQQVRQFKGHTGAVLSAVYSPDGRSILSAGSDQVMVWDVSDLAAGK